METGTRRWVTWLAAAVAALLLAHTVWNVAAGRQLRRTVKAQEQRGYPSAVKDLIPEAPGERADASAPLAKAYALMEQGRETGKGRYALVVGLLAYHDGSRPGAPAAFSLPTLDAKQKKGLWQAVDSDSMRPVYQLIEDASRRPSCQFEPDLSLGIAAVPRDVVQLRNAMQLLLLRSWLLDDGGRHDAAVGDLSAATRLCAFLEGYPLLVAQLQRVSAGKALLARVAESLMSAQPGAISPGALEDLNVSLGVLRDPDHVGLARAVDGERVLYGAWLGRGILQGRPLSAIGATLPGWLRWYSCYPARPMLENDINRYLHAMADGRDYVRLAMTERRGRTDPSTAIGRCYPLSRALVPRFGRLAGHVEELETAVEQARAAVVLASFRAARKRYPETWSETGAPEPIDPMGGKLSYARAAEGYLITGAGLNGRDEGGEGDDIV